MKLLLAQPSILRFQWELEVLLTNLQQFGDFDIVLLFTKHDDTVPVYLADKYGVQCFVYPDLRMDKSYVPSIRPYLLWQYFTNHPEAETEQFLYIDSDIIFREMINFATLPFDPKVVYGADCDGYIGLDYILRCTEGEQIANKMAEICGITINQMRGIPGIGAHIILNGTNAAFWERSYDDCQAIYQYLLTVPSNLQKWTAEMWSQQWGWVREGKTLMISDELDFCRPTDAIEKWDKFKILHNAGVTGTGPMFFKGAYVSKTPFDEDFSQIDKTKASLRYVQAIQNVVL